MGGEISEKLEKSIRKAQLIITNFVENNKLDVIIAHNTCYAVNFVLAVALSRYYRDAIKKKKKTPKYVLWWHDSHFERKQFENPSLDVERYLLQGIPGKYVEYIFFINSTQFEVAEHYFQKLNKLRKGFYKEISENNDVIYNTADTYIDSFDDLRKKEENERVKKFLNDYKVFDLLHENNTSLKDTIFCLQHTRLEKRKRVDFALKYVFEFLNHTNKRKKKKKSLYFLVDGMTYISKAPIKKLHRELQEKYKTDKVFLVFSDEHKTEINFEEYPRIFAKLGGFSTYFSEIEGFGNNLLEVLASGLLPVVYTYPVFKADIAKYKFNLIALNEFEVDKNSLIELEALLKRSKKRKLWANKNLEILRKNFHHRIIELKLIRGIIRERMHE